MTYSKEKQKIAEKLEIELTTKWNENYAKPSLTNTTKKMHEYFIQEEKRVASFCNKNGLYYMGLVGRKAERIPEQEHNETLFQGCIFFCTEYQIENFKYKKPTVINDVKDIDIDSLEVM